MRRLAPHVRTALVTGETGTGKELVARALHRIGPRGDRRFVTVNCSAVVESLFENEALSVMCEAPSTGRPRTSRASSSWPMASTLFLDEVGELPLPLQAKLLRVLETGEVTGSDRSKPAMSTCTSLPARIAICARRSPPADSAATFSID